MIISARYVGSLRLLNIIFKIIERAINDAVLEVVRPVEFVK
jgi:hypothetical protein